jgi:hypothetical protein
MFYVWSGWIIQPVVLYARSRNRRTEIPVSSIAIINLQYNIFVFSMLVINCFYTGLKQAKSNAGSDDVQVGDHVLVAGKRTGVVRFIGNTEFAPGIVLSISSIGCYMFSTFLNASAA